LLVRLVRGYGHYPSRANALIAGTLL
jgi:hypothetical protein